MNRSTVGVAVVGLGFMGRTHVAAIGRARRDRLPCRLVAVHDVMGPPDDASPSGNFDTGTGDGPLYDPKEVRFHEQVVDLFADDAVDLVHICTPTDSHVALASQALEAGKNVLVEKPVALSVAEIDSLIAVAEETDLLCMPAMCMRFWPGWDWLEQKVSSGELGKVRSAFFQRVGTAPTWSRDFYLDAERSGGALVDLHIHDVDIIHWLFGTPEEVTSSGDRSHVVSQYRYASGPASVVAEGGWFPDPSYPFQVRYRVAFEESVADYDIGREEPLILHREGEARAVELADGNGYDGEVRHIIETIAAGRDTMVATLEDARAVTTILEAEGRSLDEGCSIAVG